MRAATVCFPFVGGLVGGSHISAAGLIRRLDRARFRPVVALQHPASVIADLLDAQGIGHEPAPATAELPHGRPVDAASALRLVAAVPRLVRFLRNREVAIVHCNDGRTLATWALATRIAGAKLLWHHRGAPDAAGLRWLAPVLADRVVAVSRFAAPPPGRFSAAGRTSVIHSPFDTAVRPDRARARAMLREAVPAIGAKSLAVAFSGALIDRKRPLLFVAAMAALIRRMGDRTVHGVILGEALDDMGDRLAAAIAEHGLQHRIHLLGFRVPGPNWIAACDLLMVPAINEPFGRTLIEAMLVGTPVLATASGGNVEAIAADRTGVLVPPEDADALAAAADALLADPDRRAAIAQAARHAAERRFGEQAHADAVMALYAEMLPAPPAAFAGVRIADGQEQRPARFGPGM